MACTLLRELNQHPKLNLSVILLNNSRLASELRTENIKIQILDENRLPFSLLLRKTRDLIRTNSPDIIHAHRYKENLLAFLGIQGICRPALISTLHGLPELRDKQSSLPARFKSWLNFTIMSRYFTKTVAVSDDIRNQLKERYRFADKRVVVIHNGVHLPDKTGYDSPTSAAHHFTIGSSGRLFPVKDFPLFVEIARIVVQQEPSIRFELAGEGPGRPQLESLLAAYNLQDRFHLHGHLDDMDAFYKGLDLYLNTSLHEGIPMTILEAMGRGIPVIAPAVGGIREIITPGNDGFLIDGRDPYSFAEQCLLLYRDRQLRQAMALAACETVDRDFSVGKMADRYYQLYCNITNSAHREGAR